MNNFFNQTVQKQKEKKVKEFVEKLPEQKEKPQPVKPDFIQKHDEIVAYKKAQETSKQGYSVKPDPDNPDRLIATKTRTFGPSDDQSAPVLYTKPKTIETRSGFFFRYDESGNRKLHTSSSAPRFNTTKAIELSTRAGFVGATRWPHTIYWLASKPFTKRSKQDYGQELVNYEKGSWSRAKHDKMSFLWEDVINSPAMTDVAYPLAIGAGIGAGVGSVKAAFPTAGKWLERGIMVGGAALFGKETGEVAARNPEELPEYFARAGFIGVISYPAYKAGHNFGYGRTETYLYSKHTFKSGSAEQIRFNEAMKVARLTENVKSGKAEPLDIAKDIIRMDSHTANRTIKWIKQNPDTVIGGSAASKTQVVGARTPRDIDILVPEKKLLIAKKFFEGYTKTPSGEHRIDIHSFEFGGKGGKYHRFGFETKSPTKIQGTKYMRSGEQVFRKGIGGTTKEFQYRWFKDQPDFVTTAKSQISSSSGWRAKLAQKHLNRFLNPESSPGYGKPSGKISGIIKRVTKPPAIPKEITSSTGGASYYQYPSYVYPKPPIISYYPTGYINKPKPSYYTPIKPSKPQKTYTPRKEPSYKTPIYTQPTKPQKTYTPREEPSYKTPTPPPPYKPPTYTPTKKPPYKTPPYIPTKTPPIYFKTKKPKRSAPIIEKKHKKYFEDKYRLKKTKYRFRKFKIESLFKKSKGGLF